MSWQFDAGHTHIGFTGRHLMVSTVRGEFEKFSGTVEFDEYDLTRSKAEIQLELIKPVEAVASSQAVGTPA
jgi:polyisoprenoid-binding protein YceI